MKYGVLGTGSVAQTIASKLIELGHHVMMGSRTAQNEKAVKWVSENGERAECGFWVPVFGQLNTMHWGFRLVR